MGFLGVSWSSRVQVSMASGATSSMIMVSLSRVEH